MPDAYDCIVIGSGPGGYVAAIRAAQLGMKTAVVKNDDVVGGRCLNYACIPAKAVLRSADVLSEVRDADEFGISLNGADLTVDFAQVGNRRDKVIKTLTGGVSGLFKKNGIEVISGHGSVTEDGNVKVGGDFDGTEYEVRKAVILATGSVAKPIPGTEFGPRIIDTQGAWLLDELPDSIAVIGAGASGTEIASGYARLRVVRKRIGWLLFLFVAGTLTSKVLHSFEDELATVVALNFFVPLLIGTGGNAGSQTVMTVIRSLSLGEIGLKNAWRVTLREGVTGLMIGSLIGIIAFGQAFW